MEGTRAVGVGTIVVSFVVALEIVIMISPFALFFYSVFNPVLLALGATPATRWLTAFFLPHMVVPPDALLATLRVLGSILFVAGLVSFLICAVQVYGGKLGKRGVAERGLYAIVRHPQYLSLAVSGAGLAILWPRFLTLVLLAVMFFLYYLLATDEERRMLRRHGEGYRAYMARTGMFLPRLGAARPVPVDAALPRVGVGRALGVLAVLLVALVGVGFGLRAYTIHHLPLASLDGADALAISADDLAAVRHLLPGVLRDPAVASRLPAPVAGHRLLAYVVPVDYAMQGMIADTGEEWRLFERHRTLAMITDYVLHPVGHLTEGHAHGGAPSMPLHDSPALKRRIILVEVSVAGRPLLSAQDDFGIDVARVPRLFVDVHLHTGDILRVEPVAAGSGWGTVPTPTF